MDNLRLLEEFLDDKKNIASLRYFCKRYVRDDDIAEDIAQDALLKMYSNIHKFDEKRASIKTIVFWFAKNLAKNYLRDNKRVFLPLKDEYQSKDNPLGNILAAEQEQYIHAMVDTLTPKVKLAITDFYLNDNNNFKRDNPSFYVRLQNGRDILRKQMEKNNDIREAS